MGTPLLRPPSGPGPVIAIRAPGPEHNDLFFMELIYYLIFLDRDKMDVYWDKTTGRETKRERERSNEG